MRTSALALLGSLALFLSTSALGDWACLSAEEIAEQSELIVVGELIGRVRLQMSAAEQPENIGIVRVDEVLKGDEAAELVLLKLTPTRPGRLVLSTDVSLEDGQRGLWYLLAEGRLGLFEVNRPNRFVPLRDAADRIRALKSQGR